MFCVYRMQYNEEERKTHTDAKQTCRCLMIQLLNILLLTHRIENQFWLFVKDMRAMNGERNHVGCFWNWLLPRVKHQSRTFRWYLSFNDRKKKKLAGLLIISIQLKNLSYDSYFKNILKYFFPLLRANEMHKYLFSLHEAMIAHIFVSGGFFLRKKWP